MRLKSTKNINSRLNLGGTTCAPVYKKLITCFPKAQHFVGTRPRLWLIKRPVSIGLCGKDLTKDKVVCRQLKILFRCYEDEVYLCSCISSPPWRLLSWITYCGHKFGGTVFSYFWVAGDVTRPWVWLDHYDGSLSSSGPTALQKVSWPRRRVSENWAWGNFPSAFNNVNECKAKPWNRPGLPGVLAESLLQLGSQTSAVVIKTVSTFSALTKGSCHLVLRTSLQHGLYILCWKVGDFLTLEAGLEVNGKWVAYQKWSVLVPKWGFVEGGSPEVSRKERCCFIWNVFLPHSVPQ